MDLIGGLFKSPERMWFEGASGRSGTFDAVTISEGKRIAVVGTRLSRDGLAFVSEVAVRGGNEVPVTFTIRRRTIPSRVRIIKYEPARGTKRVTHRYFCTFVAISDDDRAAVVRYVDDMPETTSAGHAPGGFAGSTFSFAVQGTIADHLVRLKRLSPPGPGMAPLIRLDSDVPRKLEDGRSCRDIVVHSRVRTETGVRGFETRFRVFADERVEVVN
jgi:PilZ domain